MAEQDQSEEKTEEPTAKTDRKSTGGWPNRSLTRAFSGGDDDWCRKFYVLVRCRRCNQHK